MSLKSFGLVVSALSLMIAVCAGAADFSMARLPTTRSENSFDLKKDCGGNTYYSFMQSDIYPRMVEIASRPSRMSNEDALSAGAGVAVRLNNQNYNFHVNFPHGAQGGRSYGWTEGKVGDWSDKMYLDNLAEVVAQASDEEFSSFYQTVIGMLGNCNADSLSDLSEGAQRVANNFLAIYTAEEYRAMVGTPNWDDALLQVTLVAAFHGGQETLFKFYLGEFTADSYKQAPGVYRGSVAGTPKRAALNDYWQFSANAASRRSGLNLTRKDFELMGKAITEYESTVGKSRALRAVQAVVGEEANVIRAITRYFTQNAADPAQGAALARNVAKLMLEVRADAPKITHWVLKGQR